MNNLKRQESLLQRSEEQKTNKAMIKANSSKIISISESAKGVSNSHELDQLLSDSDKSPLYRVEHFFEQIFEHQELPFFDHSTFKKWQMKLSAVIIEGQNNFEFVNTISPMELSEVLLVGYKSMLDRCQSTIGNNFFEIWMKTNRRILLA